MSLVFKLTGALSRAVNDTLDAVFPSTCTHSNAVFSGHHCPDCGKAVAVEWVQVRCSRCHTRRAPKPSQHPPFQAQDKHCRFCGSAEITVQKKPHIERYELPYSLLYRSTTRHPAPLTLHLGLQYHRAAAAIPLTQAAAFQSIVDITVD